MNKYLEAGIIVNTHGIDGKVKIECWCDGIDVLLSLNRLYIKYGGEYREFTVERSSAFKQWALVKFKDCNSFESANLLRNKLVYADRADIPLEDGAMFVADMIGLPVKNIDSGKVYGTLAEVIDGVGNRLYSVNTENGNVLIPAVKEFIKETSLEKGILVKPIEGMFDEI